jgi:capsular exopolysaccharide synthesis family protein
LSEPTTRILDLSDYWRMVRVRKWTVLICAVAMAGLLSVYVLIKPSEYTSQVTVQVNPLVSLVSTTLPGGTSTQLAPNMVNEVAVVKSLTLASTVQQALNLTQTPQQLVKQVAATPGRDSDVMVISATAKNPAAAAAIASAYQKAYFDQRQALVLAGATPTLKLYQGTLASQQKDLKAATAELLNTLDPNRQFILHQQILADEAAIADTKTKLLTLTGTVNSAVPATLLQSATAPSSPNGPALPLAIAIGLVLGAIIGAGLAIALGLRANRVGGRDELAVHLSAPVMAMIPKVEGWDKTDKAQLVTRDDPGAPASEAYRTLATNIRFFRSQQPLRVLVVTSALPSEGKSATAANLAVILAETGLRTVLVDADLRRPRASRFVKVADHAGLHEALEGTRDLVDVIQATEIENLWIVGAGTVPRDPVSLLAGPNSANVFDGLRRVADIVVCDAPPVLPVADASVLAEISDAVLFVHDPAISNRTSLEDAVKQLRTAGGAIIGGVYNNVSAAQRSYLGYASYDSYYGQERKHHKGLDADVPAEPVNAGASANGRKAKEPSSKPTVGMD